MVAEILDRSALWLVSLRWGEPPVNVVSEPAPLSPPSGNGSGEIFPASFPRSTAIGATRFGSFSTDSPKLFALLPEALSMDKVEWRRDTQNGV